MFLAEKIIDNLIESKDDSDLAQLEQMDDLMAFEYLAKLYQSNYGALPSGTAIYFLRNKFQLGTKEENIRFIPKSFF